MLQLSGTIRNATVRIAPLSSWRIYAQQLLAASSRAANPNPVLTQAKEEIKVSPSMPKVINKELTSENPMIQAAFDNLKGAKDNPIVAKEKSLIAIKIEAAENIEDLLSIANDKDLMRENAFAIVTQLLHWVHNGKADLKAFELDSRFLHLCMLLSKPAALNKVEQANEKASKKFIEQLHSFYNLNEINEATKEVANLPVSHMIKVMSGLASQRRRNTPLLRALSLNIRQSEIPLDIKQLSDLFYSMSILNYTDEVLLEKACGDLINLVQTSPNSSVVGSIIRSLGSMRYKNEDVMNELSKWIVDHTTDIRSQDLCSLFVTLAILGHTPKNVDMLKKVVVDHLKETDMSRPSEWLDVVWALVILQLAEDRHIASVLDSKFVQKLSDTADIPLPKKTKLLNINAAAQLLMKGYKGPLLKSDSAVFDVAIMRSKEKEAFVSTVISTLEHIYPSPEYCKTNVDSGMGFLIDAEIRLNKQGERLPVNSTVDKTKGFRLAVVAYYYHDFSRGKQEPLGFNTFYCRLLKSKGYKILTIPHTEFSPEDKTVQRITYILDRIKSITK